MLDGSPSLSIALLSAAVALGFTAACASSTADADAPAHVADAGSPEGNDARAPSFGDDGGNRTTGDDCTDATRLIYTLDSDRMLRSLDPKTLKFETIGALDCPTDAETNSMAVDRAGNAWVLFDDGSLFKASIKDASCTATSFVPGQSGIWTFGMGFATDATDSTSETLFIAGYQPDSKLARLSLDTMKLSVIGDLDRPARAELSGTGSGQLFALFDGASPDDESGGLPFAVAEVDKTSSKILSLVEQTTMPQESLNFAFAAWDGDFYLFAFTSLYRYRPSTKQTVKLTETPFLVVGAGVSTCAPHTIVK